MKSKCHLKDVITAILSIFFFFFLLQILVSQNTTDGIKSKSISDEWFNQDTTVYTPFGPAIRSKVHFIGGNECIKHLSDEIQIINKNSGLIVRRYGSFSNKNEFGNEYSNKNISPSTNLATFIDNGWITYAEGEVLANEYPIQEFSSEWTVPEPPLNKSTQLIYLFEGLQTIESGLAHIVQPVLQWGKSPAGGGQYWAICNWYVNSSGLIFYDSLIQVYPGTKLKGSIELVSSNNESQFSYYSNFEGFSTGLHILDIPKLHAFYIALEGYNVIGCDQYPFNEKARFSNINVQVNNNNPEIHWYTYPAGNDCGQNTIIVDPSSSKGEVHILFHSPSAIDNFDDLHIYPNPTHNILHLSPNGTLLDFKVEIFNSKGEIVYSDLKKRLDFEFNIDMSSYSSGLYLLRIQFNKYENYRYFTRSHTFKIIVN